MKTNKFEKLVEYIINEDEAKAKALFHQIVVEKSRDIYESLEDESRFPVQRGRGAEALSDEISDHSDEIDADMEGMHEAEDEFGDEDVMGDEDSGFGDEEGDDEFSDDDAAFGGDEEGMGGEEGLGGEEEIEDRVMDLEDAIDELKAEFDQLMAGEEHEEEEFPGIHGEEGVEGDEGEVEPEHGEEGVEGDEEEEEMDESASIYEAKKMKDEKAKKDKEEKAKKEKAAKDKKEKDVKESRKSPADLMREYVEKVTAVKPVEGDEVGTGTGSGGKVNVNKKSTQIGGKNDMGGTTANIARGGNETAPDGIPAYKEPKNEYSKGRGDLPGAGKFANVAGGRGDKLTKVSKPSSKEGAPAGAKNTEGGKINDKSIGQVTGGKPGFTQAKKG